MTNPVKTGTKPRVRWRVLKAGPRPACVQGGGSFCRGCSGWASMEEAASRPESGWRDYPLHCPASGLTVKADPDTENRQPD